MASGEKVNQDLAIQVKMTATHLTHGELHADAACNPLGTDKTELTAKVARIFAQWRTQPNATRASELHQDIPDDFQDPIGGVAVFVRDANAAGGLLDALHGFLRHPGQAGSTAAERRHTFCCVDDIDGIDIHTTPFDTKVLEHSAAINTGATPARHKSCQMTNPTLNQWNLWEMTTRMNNP